MSARQARKARRAEEREARKLAEKQQISEAKLAANRANAENRLDPRAKKAKPAPAATLLSTVSIPNNSFSPVRTQPNSIGSRRTCSPNTNPPTLPKNCSSTKWPSSTGASAAFASLKRKAWENPDPDQCLKLLSPIQRLMSAAERGFHKALNTLRQLQKARGFVSPTSPANGFVPTTSQPAASQPSRGCQGAVGFVPQTPCPSALRNP
jgi:hypothetical protein